MVKWKGEVEDTEEGPVLYVGIRFYSFHYFYIVCFCLTVFAFLSVSSFVFVFSNPIQFRFANWFINFISEGWFQGASEQEDRK